jgi:hypothetical protein
MGQTHSGAATVLHDILEQSSGDQGTSAELLEIVSAMAEPSELTELILSLYKDDQAISACARRSFWHPLGFNKLAVIDALPLYILRIHVWWPDTSTRVDHVHNHRFDFISSVVHGSYDMQMYEKNRTGSPMVEYREEVSPELGWRLCPVATTRIRPLTTIRLQQGTSYALPAETLHRVAVKQEAPCVTLFLQTKISRSTTQVFINQGDPVPETTPKDPLTCDNYRRQLESIIALLQP